MGRDSEPQTSSTNRLNYANKIILAPMVRIGTLPMRLLALDYGADIVYTEELIDWKLLRSTRKENPVLGTIDYVDKTDGTIVFRTCPREKEHVVLQIGTSDATRAATVGKIVERDVAGIDINMGCPKKFSIAGGMGAALLKNPEKAVNILKTVVDNITIPVTCKIRILPCIEKTVDLCQRFANAGVSAITVHGRTVDERPQHPNKDEFLKEIANRIRIPIIANGGSRDMIRYADILKFKAHTGCSSVMIARAAEWNCSIFRKDGPLPIEDVIKAYLKYAIDYDNSPSNTKYCVQNILRDLQETPLGKEFLAAQTLEQICACWDLDEYCRAKEKEFRSKGFLGRYDVGLVADVEEQHIQKKRKMTEENVTRRCCPFLRNSYRLDVNLPKTKLMKWITENGKGKPIYETTQKDKLFRSVVTVDGEKFGSSFWEKNKKWAEQGAALVCLRVLGIETDATMEEQIS